MKLQTLLDITDDIKQECIDLKNTWHEDDVRHSFFGMFYSTIYDYYIGKVAYRMSELIGSGDVRFTEKAIDFVPHAKKMYEVQDDDTLTFGYNNKLNRDLFLGAWTSFETAISLLFEYIATNDDQLEIIEDKNKEILKIISGLEEPVKDELKAIVLKQPQFIPIARKFSYLRKKDPEKYPKSQYKKDSKFLGFCTNLRNCVIHSNGIYTGKDSEYEFLECSFKFVNGQVMQQDNSNGNTYYHIAFELRDVFLRLTKCLTGFSFIEYPNDGQNIK